MPKKRTHGEGYIQERPDGRWVFRIRENGRERRIYARTRRELIKKIRDGLPDVKVREESVHDETPTVAEYLDAWLETDVLSARRRATYNQYRVAAGHFKAVAGHLRISAVTIAVIEDVYAELRHGVPRPAMLNRVHLVMRRAWNTAQKKGIVTSNPFLLVEKPRYAAREMRFLSAAEAVRLLTYAKKTRIYALVATALGTGARLGEVFGLQWQDIDWENRRILIRRSLSEASGKPEKVEPKTKGSVRFVKVTLETLRVLQEHLEQSHARSEPEDYVFTQPDGSLIRKSNFHRRDWRPLVTAAGFATLRFHDLRHTHATLLLGSGVHPKVVAERLGHTNVQFTIARYTHVMPGLHDEAVDRLAAALSIEPTVELRRRGRSGHRS